MLRCSVILIDSIINVAPLKLIIDDSQTVAEYMNDVDDIAYVSYESPKQKSDTPNHFYGNVDDFTTGTLKTFIGENFINSKVYVEKVQERFPILV